MPLSRDLSLALRTLRRNRLRSFLMAIGVTVGIASLTTLASVGEATRQETVRQFKRMLGTTDLLTVRPGRSSTRGMPTLTTVDPTLKFEDARAIASDIASVSAVVEVQNAFDIDMKYGDRTTSPSLFGVSAGWITLRGDRLAAGSDLTREDDEGLARVAVIGEDVRRELFAGEDPMGRILRIADVPFTIKGVLAPRGAGPGGASLDNLVLIPVSTASKRLFNRDYLTMILVQVRDPARADRSIADITALLRERHHILPPAEDDFVITSPAATLAKLSDVGSTLSRILTGVSVLATLIGGAVIMSLMLIGVSERRREIGVRRALGASRRDVLRQFLVEAMLISLVGGLAGVLIGVGGTVLATTLQKLPVAVLWLEVLGAVLLSVAVGLIFGLQPAWKASRVDPIEALRA